MMIKNWTRRYFDEVSGEGSGEGAAPTTPTPAPAAEETWLSVLPEDMRNNATLQDIKSVESLAKQLIDTKAMVGGSVRVPSSDASVEDMDAFRKSLLDKNVGLMAVPDTDNAELMSEVYKSMGQPDDASAYKMPEDWVGMTDERFGSLAQGAHAAGLSKGQFDSLSQHMAKDSNDVMSEIEANHNAGMSELKNDWGRAYDEKVARANNIAVQLEATDALLSALKEGSVDAETLRWLDKISTKFGGEGTALVTDPGGLNENTPTELRERVAEITKKMLNMNGSDPQYQALLKKRIGFLELLNPEKK